MTKWKSCCFDIDAEFVQYLTYAFFNFGAITFCMIQLYESHDCNVTSNYLPLLTMCIGALIPTPSLRKRDTNSQHQQDEGDENLTEMRVV